MASMQRTGIYLVEYKNWHAYYYHCHCHTLPFFWIAIHFIFV